MPLEAEFLGLFIGAFSVVLGIAVIAVLILWFQKKNNSFAYVWTLLHLVFFSVAVYFLLKAISFDYEHVMASEENSLHIGIAGIFWAISMVCFLIGIYKFSNSTNLISNERKNNL